MRKSSVLLLHHRWAHSTCALYIAAPFLFFEAPFARCTRGYRSATRFDRPRCFAYQLDEARHRIGAIAALRPETLCRNDDVAARGSARPCKPQEPCTYAVGKRTGMSGVEPQLDGSRHLVDVLASRAGGPYESLLDLRFVERDLIVDSYHRSTEVSSDAERVSAFSKPAASEFVFCELKVE